MFLELLHRRNEALLRAAVDLHRSGALPPNTFALDLDAITRNASAISAEADRLGLTTFAMTKQIGRNPDALRAIRRGGISRAVAVDMEGAAAVHNHGMPLGHIGHLVQIPRHQSPAAAALRPDYWTVFSRDKAREAGAAATREGYVQDLLLRIVGEHDVFYRGHQGGVKDTDLLDAVAEIDAIDGVRFAGITTFPAALFDPEDRAVHATPNLETLSRALERLIAAGREGVQVNAPGTTSAGTLQFLAEAGANQIEPGHGLTGTTPWHAVQDLIEEPAITYVTEVSHIWDGRAYVFGGGFYVDPVVPDGTTSATVVPHGDDSGNGFTLPVEMPSSEAIDYYATIPLEGRAVEAGDTVVFGFRPQVFVSRGLTAGISGVGRGEPHVEGLWASNGAQPLLVNGRPYAL